jgi:hypothetical protein
MQPTPVEVIDGVRRILKDVIEPSVESPYARNRLAEVRAVLAQVDWNDSLTALARDNAAVDALARDALAWLDGVPDPCRELAALRPALVPASPDVSARIEPFAVHNERSKELSRTMIALSVALVEWLRQHPEDRGAQSLLDAIRRHYAHGE